MYDFSARRFLDAHASFTEEGVGVQNEVRYPFALGIDRGTNRIEDHKFEEGWMLPSAPGANTRELNFETLLQTIFAALGEQDLGSMVAPQRKRARPNRDLGIFILRQLSSITQAEIGRLFGVSATAISKAVKRARRYCGENEIAWERVKQIMSVHSEL